VGKSVNIKLIKQQQTNWCWAACTLMIYTYYNVTNTSQCQLANQEFGKWNNCCVNGSSSACDQPLSNDNITKLLNVENALSARFANNTLTFFNLDTQIGYNQPVLIGINWTAGGGHVALAVGTNSSNNNVTLNDPAEDAQKVVTYNDLKNGYGAGSWDETWYNIDSPT
jgi:hypothetical protein